MLRGCDASAREATTNGMTDRLRVPGYFLAFLAAFFFAAFFVTVFFFAAGVFLAAFFFLTEPFVARSAKSWSAWSMVISLGSVPFGREALVSPSVT